LFDPATGAALEGLDCKTKVTIIDDDKPGQVGFEQAEGSIKVLSTDEFAEIRLKRKNGSDGEVIVDYETQELDKSSGTATPW
jgi:hypothetical protein